MSIDLKKLFVELRLPVGLIAVFGALLLMFGVSLDKVVEIAGQLVGVWLCVGLLIDVLKYTHVVDDGTAGKWSAAVNLVVLAGIAAVLVNNPTYDFTNIDKQFITFAQFGTIVFGYIINVVGSKGVHGALSEGLGLTGLSLSKG